MKRGCENRRGGPGGRGGRGRRGGSDGTDIAGITGITSALETAAETGERSRHRGQTRGRRNERPVEVRRTYYGQQMVTRKMRRLFDSMQVRDCFVGLERNIQAESLCWLNMTATAAATVNAASTSNTANSANNGPNLRSTQQQNTTSHSSRRASIASSNLFVVDNNVREVGSDYLQKIPRSNRVNLTSDSGTNSTATTSATIATVDPVSDETEKIGSIVGQDDEDEEEYVDYTELVDLHDPFASNENNQNDILSNEENNDDVDGAQAKETEDEYFYSEEQFNEQSQTIALEIELVDEDLQGFTLAEFFAQFTCDEVDYLEEANTMIEPIESGELVDLYDPFASVENNQNDLLLNEENNDNNDDVDGAQAEEFTEQCQTTALEIESVDEDLQGFNLAEFFDQFTCDEVLEEANTMIERIAPIESGCKTEEVNTMGRAGCATTAGFSDELNLFCATSLVGDNRDNNTKVIWSSPSSRSSHSTRSTAHDENLQNNFDPFRRLPSRPFTFGRAGRARSMSIDSRRDSVYDGSDGLIQSLQPSMPIRRHRSCVKIPDLETIAEEPEWPQFGDSLENIFN